MVCGAGLLTHVGRPAPSNGIHANRPHPNTSELGRFLRKRRSVHLPVLQHSKPPALPADRSEIGPYQGSSSGYIPESFHQPGLTRTPPR